MNEKLEYEMCIRNENAERVKTSDTRMWAWPLPTVWQSVIGINKATAISKSRNIQGSINDNFAQEKIYDSIYIQMKISPE